MSERIKQVPVVMLKDICVIPGIRVRFDIKNDSAAMKALKYAQEQKTEIFVAAVREITVDGKIITEFSTIGAYGKLEQLVDFANDIGRALLSESVRAKMFDCKKLEDGWYMADIEPYPEKAVMLSEEEIEACFRSLKEAFASYMEILPLLMREGYKRLASIQDFPLYMNRLISMLPLDVGKKLEYICIDDNRERCKRLIGFLQSETEILKIKDDLKKEVKERVDENQKTFYLREELKAIRKELKLDDADSEAEQFFEQTERLEASEEVKERIRKEIRRYQTQAPGNSESNVIRGYIETLLELPWDKVSQENEDIFHAKKILEQEHYGLEKVKERIIEYLAVRTFQDEDERMKSPILCLAGPPGTGKTSIAKSVAKALNREYVRISLGGVRDEAEIRGHRRTYVGAMPGRFVTALRRTKVGNPLILLDEIDKMASDYKGDPASALLEVLDGEQNDKFRDHYVEISVDLSKVLFIATANDVASIPGPLLDRMEVIEISSYTQNEKLHIAQDYLIEKQKKQNGLEKKQLTITKTACAKVIEGYTREAGVRQLERVIGKLCRKAVMELLQGETKQVKITAGNLEDYLGRVKYLPEAKKHRDEVGIVRGLAWTSVGGETLEIEVNFMPGKGEMVLTGSMGDVMKESAQIAVSYVRSVAASYGIESDFFDMHDMHLHIPEGAVPKDGPSAGITMSLAVLSAATNRKVRADLAMTGEVTLRGRVLPIGGLKEKLLAAKLAGMKKVLVPLENEKDVEELSGEITEGMEIVSVRSMEEVVLHAFDKDRNTRKE